jgi:hypothetical protein
LIICFLFPDLSVDLDVNQVVNQFIEYLNDSTLMKKEEIEKLINSLLNKLSILQAVKETDLFLFRREKDILLLMKQLSFIILYYSKTSLSWAPTGLFQIAL